MSFMLCALLCFLSGFLIALWQNPSSIPPLITLYFDAGHYLDSAAKIYNATKDLLAGHGTLASAQSVTNYLMLDGPILPSFGALCFTLSGKAPVPANWFVLVYAQCLLHGITSTLVYLTTWRLTKQHVITSLAAGLLWALYPPAIAGTGMFLTETLACFLATASILCLTSSTKQVVSGVGSASGTPNASASDIFKLKDRLSMLLSLVGGITSAWLCLLKPALLPAICSILAIITLKKLFNKQFLCCVFLLVGLILAWTPWLTLTRATSGSFVLIPSRLPVYNIAHGCNIETDGWATYPSQAAVDVFSENDSALSVGYALLHKHPSELVNLTLRKISRIWALPWNDYRYKILGLNYKLQIIIHQILLALGLLGSTVIGAQLLTNANKWIINNSQKSFLSNRVANTSNLPLTLNPDNKPTNNSLDLTLGLCCLIMIFGHVTYLPFVGIDRYGFTAMPFFVILALVFFTTCRKQLLTLLFATWCLFLVVYLILSKVDLLPVILLFKNSVSFALQATAFIRILACGVLLFISWKLLKQSLGSSSGKKELVICLATVFVLVGSITISYATVNMEPHEWQTRLKTSESAVRQLDLTNITQPDWALLAIDGTDSVNKSQLSINNKPLIGSLESIYQFNLKNYDSEDYFKLLASLIHQPFESMRQWRVIEVPLNYLNLSGMNTITLRATQKPVTIYGDYIREGSEQTRYIPSFFEPSADRLFNAIEDGSDIRTLMIPDAKLAPSQSFITKGTKEENKPPALASSSTDLSPSLGRQTGQFRMYLILGYKHSKDNATQSTAQMNVSPASALKVPVPLMTPTRFVYTSKSLCLTPGAHNLQRLQINLPPAMLNSGTHIKVDLDIDASVQQASSLCLATIIEANEQKPLATILPSLLNIKSPGQQKFHISSYIPIPAFASAKQPQIILELSALPNPIYLRNLVLTATVSYRSDLRHHSIRIL